MSKALGSKYTIETSEKAEEYYEIVKDLLNSDIVKEMKNYRHHYSTTCYQHSLNVSYYNYVVCKKLGLNYKQAARAGMLHDLFLYDWRVEKRKKGELPHGFTHPKKALENAKQHFDLDKREEDIIIKHMWPLTVKLPKYPESYVIVMMDKYSAMVELGSYFKGKVSSIYKNVKPAKRTH
ncbi:MAG: HD family phosphohydrolase [Ruminococcus sp.]|nr:HD family phosphohydrolase [Ruminococcus sp.]